MRVTLVGPCKNVRSPGLLHAGVEVPNDRLGAEHGLALQLQHQAQHSVRGRVLRTHIDDHPLAVLDGFVGSKLWASKYGVWIAKDRRGGHASPAAPAHPTSGGRIASDSPLHLTLGHP